MPTDSVPDEVAKSGRNPAMDFLLEHMRKHPNVEFRQAHDAAEKVGLKVFPIMWGRAQVPLGRVKPGEGKGASNRARARAGEAEAPAGTNRQPAPRRRRRRSTPTGATLSLPIPSDVPLDELRAFVDAIHAGGKAQLAYRSDRWSLEIT